MTATLNGKVALVTGASRGIGAAIVRRLAADGAAVALTYNSSPDKAEAVVKEVEAAGGKGLALRADAADADAVRVAVGKTVERFGRLNILVNNAGIAVIKPLADMSLDDFDRIVAINVRSLFVATLEAARHMGEGGRIINIGSINSDYVPFVGGALYAMSKAAVAGLTKGLARDLGPRGITINNVQPGPVETDMNPATGPFADQGRDLMALHRYAHVDEIAGFVAYLASAEAGYITGSGLHIDGGYAA